MIAAASPQTGQAEAILSPVLNTSIINQFLQQFSPFLPADTQATLIREGARFHQAKALVVPGNITLIRLPPYSPELNRIESLWQWFRSHAWSNRVFAVYEALISAAETARQRYGLDRTLIQSVCRKPLLDSVGD